MRFARPTRQWRDRARAYLPAHTTEMRDSLLCLYDETAAIAPNSFKRPLEMYYSYVYYLMPTGDLNGNIKNLSKIVTFHYLS